MATPRRLHGIAAAGGKVFVFGGSSDKQWDIACSEAYDPETDNWKPIADLPTGACAAAASIGSDAVFVALMARRMVRYNIATDDYTDLAPLPLKEWHCFSLVSAGDGRHLYLVGGMTQGRWCGAAYRYDTARDVFQALPSMPTIRRRCAAVAVAVS